MPGGGEQARGRAHLFCRNAGVRLHRFRAVARLADELLPGSEGLHVAAFFDKSTVDQALAGHDMSHGVDQSDVAAGPQLQMACGLDVRAANQFNAARIGNNQLRALTQPLFQTRCKDRMGIGRVGADDQHDIGLFDTLEVLGTGRGAKGLAEAIAGGRMADARAGIDIVVAEGGADHLLDGKHLFIGAA